MSTTNELGEELGARFRMKPAVSKICCCSVTAASGFVAAYALVAYAIALIYEIVWVIEAQAGLPIASLLLMLCYVMVISATVTLVHGLMAKENKYLLAWLITVILVLIPECALVFYMSISHWGLQGVYGGAELACYVARLPAIVCGVVLVQSAYALREARYNMQKKGMYPPTVSAALNGSEFDASHYVPDPAHAHSFTNEAFIEDNGKPAGSMPDLRRHLSSHHLNCGYPPMVLPQPPPAYWQHLAERQYAASLRAFPGPLSYGTWVGPRTNPFNNYKRRHSVVGAFNAEEYGEMYEGKMDSKSEFGYPYRISKMDTKSEVGYPCRNPYYDRFDPRIQHYGGDFDPRFCPKSVDDSFAYTKRQQTMYPEDSSYGVNLLRHDPYAFSMSRDRAYYAQGLRNSHNSVGNESDDMAKYKDVAL